MKKWDDLTALDRAMLVRAAENSFNQCESTFERIEYVKSIYNAIYEKHMETVNERNQHGN